MAVIGLLSGTSDGDCYSRGALCRTTCCCLSGILSIPGVHGVVLRVVACQVFFLFQGCTVSYYVLLLVRYSFYSRGARCRTTCCCLSGILSIPGVHGVVLRVVTCQVFFLFQGCTVSYYVLLLVRYSFYSRGARCRTTCCYLSGILSIPGVHGVVLRVVTCQVFFLEPVPGRYTFAWSRYLGTTQNTHFTKVF